MSSLKPATRGQQGEGYAAVAPEKLSGAQQRYLKRLTAELERVEAMVGEDPGFAQLRNGSPDQITAAQEPVLLSAERLERYALGVSS